MSPNKLFLFLSVLHATKLVSCGGGSSSTSIACLISSLKIKLKYRENIKLMQDWSLIPELQQDVGFQFNDSQIELVVGHGSTQKGDGRWTMWEFPAAHGKVAVFSNSLGGAKESPIKYLTQDMRAQRTAVSKDDNKVKKNDGRLFLILPDSKRILHLASGRFVKFDGGFNPWLSCEGDTKVGHFMATRVYADAYAKALAKRGCQAQSVAHYMLRQLHADNMRTWHQQQVSVTAHGSDLSMGANARSRIVRGVLGGFDADWTLLTRKVFSKPAVYVFTKQHSGKSLYMSVDRRNKRLFLRQMISPQVMPDDTRLFTLVYNRHRNLLLLQNLSTGFFVRIDTGMVTLTCSTRHATGIKFKHIK